MRCKFLFASGIASWVLLCGVGIAQDPTAPADSLPYENSGTLEEANDNAVRIMDEKNESWVVRMGDDTDVKVEGDADRDCLRPGVIVQFTAKINEKGVLQGEVDELEIVSFQGKASSGGVFAPDDDPAAAKPVRVVKAGNYRIRGAIKTCKDGKMCLIAGRTKVAGALADDAEVTLSVHDASIAKTGDTVKVKGWYYPRQRPNANFNQPGNAMGQEVTITLAKPFTVGKKNRTADRPAKSSGRSSRTSK